MKKTIISLFALSLVLGAAAVARADEKQDIATKSAIELYLVSKTINQPGMQETVEAQGSAVGDLDGDGSPELALVWTILGPTYSRNMLTVFTHDEDIYKPVADLDLDGQAALVGIQDGAVVIDHLLLAPNDPVCCPTDKKRFKYLWDGKALAKAP